MKIIHIIPGTADVFYCQNCMRDKELVMALRAQGHDVVLVPMYLPLFAEGEDIGSEGVPVFYGAVTVYLSQVVPGFRFMAQAFRRWLDSRLLLERVAKRAGATQARGLEAMTLSVLRGEKGGQRQELDRLVEWLKQHEQPDLVHLSNALLLGLAGRIHRELKVPVICSLQDEDSWIDAMKPGAAAKAWALMTEKAAEVAAFISVSDYYSDVMKSRLKGVPANRFHVIPIGVDAASYGRARWQPEAPVIGYLSRMSESLGLGTLVEAFIELRRKGSVPGVRLKVTGGKTPEDEPFLEQMKQRLVEAGVREAVEFCPVFDRAGRREFLQSLSVLSVPVPQPEAFGMYILEAMASGVPVVQPRFGAAPELLGQTGAGVCHQPGSPSDLVRAWEQVLKDKAGWERMSVAGIKAAKGPYDVGATSASILRIYGQAVRDNKGEA